MFHNYPTIPKPPRPPIHSSSRQDDYKSGDTILGRDDVTDRSLQYVAHKVSGMNQTPPVHWTGS